MTQIVTRVGTFAALGGALGVIVYLYPAQAQGPAGNPVACTSMRIAYDPSVMRMPSDTVHYDPTSLTPQIRYAPYGCTLGAGSAHIRGYPDGIVSVDEKTGAIGQAYHWGKVQIIADWYGTGAQRNVTGDFAQITVIEPVDKDKNYCTSFMLDQSHTIQITQEGTASLTLLPEHCNPQGNLEAKADDPHVVEILPSSVGVGVLFAGEREGSTKIRATLGPLTAETSVTVTAARCRQLVLSSQTRFYVGQGGGTNWQFAPPYCTPPTGHPAYASSNQAVATIDSSGEISTLSPGNAKISATDGALTGSTDIQVIARPDEPASAAGKSCPQGGVSKKELDALQAKVDALHGKVDEALSRDRSAQSDVRSAQGEFDRFAPDVMRAENDRPRIAKLVGATSEDERVANKRLSDLQAQSGKDPNADRQNQITRAGFEAKIATGHHQDAIKQSADLEHRIALLVNHRTDLARKIDAAKFVAAGTKKTFDSAQKALDDANATLSKAKSCRPPEDAKNASPAPADKPKAECANNGGLSGPINQEACQISH